MESTVVVDDAQKKYVLERCLGKGGQGEVWLTQGGGQIIKRLYACRNRKALERQIAFVRRLDLSGLHVARPLSLLKAPDLGYVAEFLEDMVSLKTLIKPGRGQSVSAWYQQTGGLRRRLRLLAHAGEALLGLHAKSLIYGDISPANIFVSSSIEELEAWLIDLDNLRHDSDPASSVYTPGYGAPELVAGVQGSTSYSDVWSFAVLVVQTLSLVHPLIGDRVADGEPELEEEALAGRLPWVADRLDDQNRCSTGLPLEMVLGTRLLDLARCTFEEGKQDRERRPGIAKWVERLHSAADQTICCPHCQSSYFANQKFCSWCSAPAPTVYAIRFHRWEPGHGIVHELPPLLQLPLTDEPVVLCRRLTHIETGLMGRKVHAMLSCVGRQVEVSSAETVFISEPGKIDGFQEVGARGRRVPLHALDQSHVVHFGPADRPHRVAVMGGRR